MFRREALLAAVLAAAGGCGPSAPPAPATVRGAVTFQGRPLAGGLVVFAPDRDKGNGGRPVAAAVEPDGSYALAADGSATVPPGWYRVTISDPPGDGSAFPAALRRPDRSGLAREVVAGRENVFVFAIEVPE